MLLVALPVMYFNQNHKVLQSPYRTLSVFYMKSDMLVSSAGYCSVNTSVAVDVTPVFNHWRAFFVKELPFIPPLVKIERGEILL